MAKTYTLSLETITPVSIGSGDKLSPYSDFVMAGEKIYYLNQNEIEKALEGKPHLMDEYVNGIVSEMDNNKSNFDLHKFLIQKLQIDIKKTTRQIIPAEAKGTKQLSTIIKNAGVHPYIPGSSVKGAIKTVLLYNWLLGEDGKQWNNNYLNHLNRIAEIQSLEERLEDKLKQYQPEVSDSGFFEIDTMEVIDIKRLNLKSGKLTITQTWETITENNKTSLSISCKEKEETEYIEWETMCSKINKYSQHSNDREWEMLQDLGNQINTTTFNSLFDFYEKTKKIIDSAAIGTAYLRLGSSKGYFFNSIGLALYDMDESTQQ